MNTFFSKVGVALCASLFISLSFANVAPALAANSQAQPVRYLEPGVSREAQARKDAELDALLEQSKTDAAGGSATIGATAVTLPDVTETKISGLTTFAGLSQQATDDAGRVFSGWADSRDGGTSVYFSRSLDQGTTWSTPKRIDRASGAGTAAGYFDLMTDGACNLYLPFIDTRDLAAGQIFISISRDCGDTWSTPVGLVPASSMQDGSFDLAIRPNGIVFIVWGDDRNDPAGGVLMTEIYSIASFNYGSTWQSEKKISDVDPATADDYAPVATFAGNGDLLVAWLSDRPTGAAGDDMWAARSSDNGLTWGADFRLNAEAATTQIITGFGICAADNHVYAVYEHGAFPFPVVFDVKVRSSHDFGASFDAATSLVGAARDAAGDQLTLSCAGSRAVVGFEAGPTGGSLDDVRVATTADGGVSWTADKKVDLGDANASGNSAADLTSSITARGDTVVAYSDARVPTIEGFYNYSPDGGVEWDTTDHEFTSFAGAHTVLMTRELGVFLSIPLDGSGATDDGELNAWVTYNDDRAGAPGMYAARLTFDRSNETLERLAGATRIETALAISADSYPVDNSVTAMVIGTSLAFPDGLAGGPLAAMVGGPLLITPTTSLDAGVAAEITRLFDGQDDPGTDLYILGGPAAIDPSVEAAIAALDPTLDIKRLEGPDRIATSIAIANELNEIRGESPSEAVLAYSRNFPDALAASAVASSAAVNPGRMPILLTEQDVIDGRVLSWLSDNAGTGKLLTLNVIGGTAVISDLVVAGAGAVVPTVSRYGGANRFETAALLNSAMFTGPTAPLTIGVASGVNFPDALTGGAHSGRLNRPLVLVQQNNIPDESMDYVTANAGTIVGGSIYGGTAAISDLVRSVMEALY